MAKRKATFTKEIAAENKAMLSRAKDLLAGEDLDTAAEDHPVIIAMIRAENPGVADARIVRRVAQALRQLRYEKYHIVD